MSSFYEWEVITNEYSDHPKKLCLSWTLDFLKFRKMIETNLDKSKREKEIAFRQIIFEESSRSK